VTQQESLALTNLGGSSGESAQAWWINRGGSNATKEGGTLTVPVNADFDQVLVSDPYQWISPGPLDGLPGQAGMKGFTWAGVFPASGDVRAKTISTNPTRFDIRRWAGPGFQNRHSRRRNFPGPPAFMAAIKGILMMAATPCTRFILERLLPSLPPDQSYPTLAYNLYLDVGGTKAHEWDVLGSAALCKHLGLKPSYPTPCGTSQTGTGAGTGAFSAGAVHRRLHPSERHEAGPLGGLDPGGDSASAGLEYLSPPTGHGGLKTGLEAGRH